MILSHVCLSLIPFVYMSFSTGDLSTLKRERDRLHERSMNVFDLFMTVSECFKSVFKSKQKRSWRVHPNGQERCKVENVHVVHDHRPETFAKSRSRCKLKDQL
jgi:hypothetical protein